jgi:hypothetical protein
VKLLVCSVFEKPRTQLDAFEAKVHRLFADDLHDIDVTSVKADYQVPMTKSSKRLGMEFDP